MSPRIDGDWPLNFCLAYQGGSITPQMGGDRSPWNKAFKIPRMEGAVRYAHRVARVLIIVSENGS